MKDDGDAGAKAEDGEEEENSGTVVENEEDAEMSDEESEYEVGGLIYISPVMAASIRKSFMALIQFFEATTRETLRPTRRNEARPPEETCENGGAQCVGYQNFLKFVPESVEEVSAFLPTNKNPWSLTT